MFWHYDVYYYDRSGIGVIIINNNGDDNKNTPVMLPLVECLLPVVTKNFGQTSQCEWGEEGFLTWDPSSGAASRRGERSRSGPPETPRGPWWAARALTGRRSRQGLGILQLPSVGSKDETDIGVVRRKSRSSSASLSGRKNKV